MDTGARELSIATGVAGLRPPVLALAAARGGEALSELAGEGGADVRVDVHAHPLGGHPDGVLDRARGRGAVADDARAVDSEEGSAAHLGVVHALPEAPESGTNE